MNKHDAVNRAINEHIAAHPGNIEWAYVDALRAVLNAPATVTVPQTYLEAARRQNLSRLLKRKGWGAGKRLASSLGVSSSRVSKLLTGADVFSDSAARRIESALRLQDGALDR